MFCDGMYLLNRRRYGAIQRITSSLEGVTASAKHSNSCGLYEDGFKSVTNASMPHEEVGDSSHCLITSFSLYEGEEEEDCCDELLLSSFTPLVFMFVVRFLYCIHKSIPTVIFDFRISRKRLS